MKRKFLTQKEIASYQLALRCVKWMAKQGYATRLCLAGKMQAAKEMAKEIRAYRAEERRVN